MGGVDGASRRVVHAAGDGLVLHRVQVEQWGLGRAQTLGVEGALPGQDKTDVRSGVVVGEDGAAFTLSRGQVRPDGAEVDHGRPGRIFHVLWVPLTVGVEVDTGELPAARNELHRPDRSVPLLVVVPPPTVGVRDGGHTRRTVQHGSQDR